jgi:two-component sensor histidine kinase
MWQKLFNTEALTEKAGQGNTYLRNYLAYPFIFLLCFALPAGAQLNKAKFQKDFNNASARTKVRLVGSIPYEELKEIYPFIKDTLDRIKRELYRQSPDRNRDLKFLFDKIDAEKEIVEHNYGRAIFVLENALRYTAQNTDDSLTCLSMLKSVFIRLKNVNKAFEMQYVIENKWHRRSDTFRVDPGLNKSYLFHMLGLQTEALDERRKEFLASQNKHDTDVILNFYNDMGVFYNALKIPDSAEYYFLRARALLSGGRGGRPLREDFYLGLLDGHLGLSYYHNGRVKEAVPLLKSHVYHSLRTGNYENAFNSYNLLVRCYIVMKDAELARSYLDSARTILEHRLNRPDLRIRFLPTQAKYYTMVNNYRLAVGAYRDYCRMNDSLILLEKERDLMNQGLTFDIERRELAFAEQEKLLREGQEEEARQKSYRTSLLAGVLVLLVIIFILVANNRKSRRRELQLSFKNRQIQDQNTQIEQSLKEKEALIKEIHHRVKNNLQIITSMLNLQIGKIEDEKTESIFFEAKQRISAIALTHQMLYQKTTFSNINLAEYIETLVRQIEATLSSSRIEIVTDLSPTTERLNIDGAVPLGLIINELLTNCYKHAFPKGMKGTITVSLRENTDTFTIQVSDNGVGLPEDFYQSETKTLGMELVYILIEQLDSRLLVENGQGSTFSFDIKKHQ